MIWYRWKVTCDMWHFTLHGLGVLIFQDLEEKDNSVSDLMDHGGVYRTASATPDVKNQPELW